MKPTSKTLPVLALLVLVPPLSAGAESAEWTQWRGPGRSAIVSSDQLADPERLHAVWKKEVGEGQSSPVIGPVGSRGKQRVYVHSRRDDKETVQALDLASGEVVWRRQFEEAYTPYPGAQSYGKGPRSTPALADGVLCSLSVTGVVTCLEAATGELLWRRAFGERFDEPYPPFGTAMSPLFDGGHLIVHVGGHPEGALLALDPRTGKEVWAYEGEGPGYSSPIAVTLGGVRQIVTQAHQNIISVAAESGELLWSHPSVTPCDQNIVTPTLAGESLVFSSFEGGVFALRPERVAEGEAAGSWKVREVWRNDDWSLYMSSPVVLGNDMVGLAHRRRGQLFALDLATGTESWAGPAGRGSYAALVAAEDRLWAVDTAGKVAVLDKADSGLEVVAESELDVAGEVWAHPVPVDRGWLLKGESELALLSWRPRPQAGAR